MRKIAIIEDDADICGILTKFLIDYHYEVYSASNGKEGVDLCQKVLPDLIILDLMLPLLSGDNVLRQLRIFADTPVIVVSAKTMVQSKIELLRMGADDYITKPFNLYELLARIEANLKRTKANAQKTEIHLTYRDIKIENCTVSIKGEIMKFTSTELAI